MPSKLRKVAIDRRRGSTSRGYTYRWQKARAAYLAEHPLCVTCRTCGKVTAATEVDHIIPHGGDMELFWDPSNWQGLCHTCHSAKTATETFGNQQGEHRPDWLPAPACRVVLVCGPPGSGKSTYVAERAGSHDTVIDLDEIKARMAKTLIYQAEKEWIGPALAARNRWMAGLSLAASDHVAWVIVSAPSKPLRKWWSDTLRAESTVVLDVPANECKRRIKADERRRPVMAEHLSAVDDWWAREKGHKSIPLKRGTDASGMPTDPLHPWNQMQSEGIR